MTLKITNYNNFFQLKGVLDRNSVYLFQQEFRHIFEKRAAIVISVEGIESMDKYGINALTELHNQAIALNKKIAIVGNGCKNLYDHFKAQAA